MSSAIFACHRVVTFQGNNISGFGTGFFLSLKCSDGRDVAFFVTNRHVISGATHFEITLNKRDDTDIYRFSIGKKFQLKISSVCGFSDMISEDEHIDIALIDITNFALDLGKEYLFQAIDNDQIVEKNSEKEISPLRSVCMIGCPKGIYDEFNNIAIARSGFLASIFEIDYNNKPWFAIDIAAYPGSSGSPVFAIDYGFAAQPSGVTKAGIYQIQLLGLLFGGPIPVNEQKVEILPISDNFKIYSKNLINIAYCLKAREIRKFALKKKFIY